MKTPNRKSWDAFDVAWHDGIVMIALSIAFWGLVALVALQFLSS